ncbi:hypothetical protein ACUOFC_22595, partial [Escherichia sp. TWPC-MK]
VILVLAIHRGVINQAVVAFLVSLMLHRKGKGMRL